MKEVLTPKYYNTFSCLGDQCRDHCCKEWSISVTPKERKFLLYQSNLRHEPVVMDSLFTYDATTKEYKLNFDQHGYCKLLDDSKKLCRMYQADGPNKMFHVCQNFPRDRTQRGSQEEEGYMLLECPEVVRLLLVMPDAFEYQVKRDRVSVPANQTKGYRRPFYFQHMRQLLQDIVWIADASYEEMLFTLGVALAQLSPYQKASEQAFFDQLLAVRQSIEAGEMRALYAQQPSTQAHQGVCFSMFKNSFEARMVGKKSNRNTKDIMHRVMVLMQPLMKQKHVFQPDTCWLDVFQNPDIQAKYDALLLRYPHAWRNLTFWYVAKFDFPTGNWQMFFDSLLMFFFVTRATLMVLALEDKPLTEEDFGDVVRSFAVMFQLKKATWLLELVQALRQGFDFETGPDDFSLLMLMFVKTTPSLAQQDLGLDAGDAAPKSHSS